MDLCWIEKSFTEIFTGFSCGGQQCWNWLVNNVGNFRPLIWIIGKQVSMQCYPYIQFYSIDKKRFGRKKENSFIGKNRYNKNSNCFICSQHIYRKSSILKHNFRIQYEYNFIKNTLNYLVQITVVTVC